MRYSEYLGKGRRGCGKGEKIISEISNRFYRFKLSLEIVLLITIESKFFVIYYIMVVKFSISNEMVLVRLSVIIIELIIIVEV